MEPITLCGAVILAFGLWVEFELKIRAVARVLRKNKFFAEIFSQPTVQKPAYMRRMPICVAKGVYY